MPSQPINDEPFVRLTLDEAKPRIDSGEFRVIDVREIGEWNSGHIDNAELIPLNSLLRDQSKIVGSNKILFVCEVGGRSAVASEMAAAVGIEEVYNLEGGMKVWRDAGFPTIR